ncbi:receptor-like protein Cf-9 homolog [Camellia sinensis]|uniref:receptor-like protein Cf-9 homolog n=1 Tax=Camellia sinensis TaxID=4442 RepID=UPI001035A9CA|nr:receptor-like protein Cf-9 homolog [Camellia sinensis]
MVFWKKSGDCCSWEEVTCDWSNGHVIGLDLNCSQLRGTIQDNNTLFHLRHLQSLNLAFNDFNLLRISSEFGSFASLTHLNLTYSNFSGQIPSRISHLSKLISLDLSYLNEYYCYYYYEGRIEQHTFNMLLRKLTQLRELHLDWLNISSPLPHALLNLSSLTSLNLFYCQLRSKFSESIFLFPILRELNVQGNSKLTVELSKLTSIILKSNILNGTILSWLFAQPSLVDIDLSDNKLQGPIPGPVYELQNLTVLVLSSNNLSGVVELDKLLNQKYLSYLNLSYTVPKWIFDVGKDSLYDLNLPHNFLTNLERLPWKNLRSIDLHSNLLQGSLPVPPNTIYFFSISDNKLTGEIPPLICGLSLAVLDVSNNSLSGLIPQYLGNFSNFLSVLNLGNNRFRGTFTTTFTKGNMLRNLNLNGNQIEGQVLVLRFNSFHGHIGTSKTKAKHPFPKLRIIDISCNDFTSLLPTNYIKQFGTMMNVDAHEMKLQYIGDYYYQDFVVILKSIGRLNSLLGLNLFHNNLEGRIPTSVGNLKNLESLDLSSKKFVGEIPQQLKSLMFLEVLNLSDNQVAGPIPQGSQFNTFGNDSYSGNLALCGFPLSKKCKELQPLPPPPTLQQDENSDNSSGFN